MVDMNGGDSSSIQDPSELAKQVNAYIEKLEAALAEVEGNTLVKIHSTILF